MTTRRLRIARWIPQATTTHPEYVSFPLHQRLHERASMLHVQCLSKNNVRTTQHWATFVNHWYSVKTTIITYSDYVFLSLVVQHAMLGLAFPLRHHVQNQRRDALQTLSSGYRPQFIMATLKSAMLAPYCRLTADHIWPHNGQSKFKDRPNYNYQFLKSPNFVCYQPLNLQLQSIRSFINQYRINRTKEQMGMRYLLLTTATNVTDIQTDVSILPQTTRCPETLTWNKRKLYFNIKTRLARGW